MSEKTFMRPPPVPTNKWMPKEDIKLNEKYPHVVRIPWTGYMSFYNHHVIAESNGFDCMHSYRSVDTGGAEEEWFFMASEDAVAFRMMI